VGLSYCRRMQRTVDMLLGLTAAVVATALLLGLIARDDVGMSADMIHIDALSVAGIIFAAYSRTRAVRNRRPKDPHNPSQKSLQRWDNEGGATKRGHDRREDSGKEKAR
jgi:hypothetical protein